MDFLAAIRRDTDRFYDVADGADPEARVPSCPDWSVADLVWHLGEVHWFWGSDVELRATEPDQIEAAKPARPTAYVELVAWGRRQAARMLELLEQTADDVAVWSWALSEADHNVGFIRRHQVQEAAIHRWDIEQAAAGAAGPIDAEVAADSIDELLTITLPWGVRADKPLRGTVHLHCTDLADGGEWLVHADGRVDRVHQKGDVALRASASELLLALYKRQPSTTIEIIGDASLADEFVARIGTD